MSPQEVVRGALSLLKGMKVTIRAFLGPSVTCQYPRETLELSPRFRGHIKLVADEEGKLYCRVCGLCARSCPTGCIVVEGVKKEGEKRKTLTRFLLDFTRCSHCGLCVEVCPTGAVAFSQEYNLASFSKEDFYFDLVEEFRRRGGG